MKRRKIFKKVILSALACMASSATIFAVACTPQKSSGTFKYFYNTDVLKDNNSPLNSAFNNSPISTYANSILYKLVTYETTVDTSNTIPGTTKFEDSLILEAADKLEVFSSEEQMKAYDANPTNKQNQPYVFTSIVDGEVKPLIEQQNYNEAISTGLIYRFTIDQDNEWIDNKGNKKAKVSGKDFERAIESYALASKIGYNRNGYFLSLMGLDLDKTVGYQENGEYVSIIDKKYNVENYANTDQTFTLYLKDPYPYALDLLSKEYFSALPHSNQKVKNTTLSSPYIATTTNENTGVIALDRERTDFNNIYGSGDINNFAKDVWYAGAYYMKNFTSTQMIFGLNSQYMSDSVMGERLLNRNDTKIPEIIVNYGSGNVDTYYELYKSRQNDYIPSLPTTRQSEAVKNYVNKGLLLVKNAKLAQSNYITYTPRAYTINSNSVSMNNNISAPAANFINDWSSKESTIVRAGIGGLINHFNLSKINLPSSGDFQLSSTPYGAFAHYYETVAKDLGLYGSLPRPYSDYVSNTNSSILGEFELPYYSYNSNGIVIENLKINQKTFQDAIQKILDNNNNQNKTNKLILSAKFGEGSFTSSYNNYLNSLKSAIETLSGNKIEFNINARNGVNPTAIEWFNEQSSPIGFSYWNPDYNGVGTWLESYVLLGDIKNNDKTYEGYSESISHNSWNTYFRAIITCLKLMNATLNSTNKQFEVGLTSNDDPFKNDSRVMGAFSSETLSPTSLDIQLDKTPNIYTKIEKNKINPNDSPGIIYGKVGVEFANYLIEKKVLDPNKLNEYVQNPSKLNSTFKPNSPDQIIVGSDAILPGKSGDFAKYLGVFAGMNQSGKWGNSINALWATTVNDSDFSFIPRSENGLNELVYSLVNPSYGVRVSTIGHPNYRDYYWKK